MRAFKNHCSSLHFTQLLWHILFVCGLLLPSCLAQEQGLDNSPDDGNTGSLVLLGPCVDTPEPCSTGDKFGDPGNCNVYYECEPQTFTLQLQHCPEGSKYDYKKVKCRVDKPDLKRAIRCTPACEDISKRKDREQNQEVEPKEDEDPNTPPTLSQTLDEGNQNSTEEINTSLKSDSTPGESDIFTQPNEVLEPSENKTDKAGNQTAEKFNQDNETIHVAVIDPSLMRPNNSAFESTSSTSSSTTTIPRTTTTTKTTSTTSSTTSTTSTTSSTTTTTSTSSTTTTTQPGVIIVETDGDPGYDIITSPPDNSSGVGDSGSSKSGVSSATIGIAAGIIGALIIAAVAVVFLICYVRKKKMGKEKKFVSIENPKYRSKGPDDQKHAYRFSRDASLFVNEKPANNNSAEKLAFIPGRKRAAPSAPSKEEKGKRKAPPPPNPFTGEIDGEPLRTPFRQDSTDLYERDTDGSTEDVELSTFAGPSSTFGTGTGTFGKGKGLEVLNSKETPNGRLQQSRSTDYSSEEESDKEDNKLLGRPYQSGDIDDAVFKDEVTAKDVNNSMDAYLSAYDQALNPFSEKN